MIRAGVSVLCSGGVGVDGGGVVGGGCPLGGFECGCVFVGGFYF